MPNLFYDFFWWIFLKTSIFFSEIEFPSWRYQALNQWCYMMVGFYFILFIFLDAQILSKIIVEFHIILCALFIKNLWRVYLAYTYATIPSLLLVTLVSPSTLGESIYTDLSKVIYCMKKTKIAGRFLVLSILHNSIIRKP